MDIKSVVTLLLFTQCVHGHTQTDSFLFIIISQEGQVHKEAEQQLSTSLQQQAKPLHIRLSVLHTSQEWPHTAAWTYFPLLSRLKEEVAGRRAWVVVVEERTQVRLHSLAGLLQPHDPSQLVFLGRGLRDQSETIIHHFDLVDLSQPFLYPDSRTGLVLSSALVTWLAEKWADSSTRPRSDFSIDAAYEFASFVRTVATSLTHHPAFCLDETADCATTFSPTTRNCKGAEPPTSSIHVAIKSCQQYHRERLPVLRDTWLQEALNYAIYSDIEDKEFGTVTSGVANTERGHCGKTMAIIRKAARLPSIQWLLIADDDTLISLPRLRSVLACYDANVPLALGERYGYGVSTGQGYDYLTGGAGMVFSKVLVDILAAPGVCECPSNDTPDDMFLGMCLTRLSVPITHSSAFHQARPMDYPEARLAGEAPVSFHKYWMVEPRQLYQRWLADPISPSPSTTHTEL